MILVAKLFKMMVMDAYVYHKHRKSHSSMMALTLQLERNASFLVVKLGILPQIATRCFPMVELKTIT